MKKPIVWVAVALAVLVLLAVGGRLYSTTYMARRAVSAEPLGSATPASASLPFVRVSVASGDRTLIGWWVRAPGTAAQPAPALLFLHGNSSTISDYVALQRFFYRQGISTFVFDYTGFGASGGTASLTAAIEDAGRVARVFADSAGLARRVAFGTALGATVLLQAIDSVQPHVNGIVFEGVDASVREAAVRAGKLPGWLAPMLTDLADNVAAAGRVTVPALAVHSATDQRAPFADAERVVAAMTGSAALVKHWRSGHGSLVVSSKPCDWRPVLDFVLAGRLPATKVDSTNACDVEQARIDSAKAAAARAAAQTKTAPRRSR